MLNQLGRALNRLGGAPVRVAIRGRGFLLNRLLRALNRDALFAESVRVAIRARRFLLNCFLRALNRLLRPSVSSFLRSFVSEGGLQRTGGLDWYRSSPCTG